MFLTVAKRDEEKKKLKRRLLDHNDTCLFSINYCFDDQQQQQGEELGGNLKDNVYICYKKRYDLTNIPNAPSVIL